MTDHTDDELRRVLSAWSRFLSFFGATLPSWRNRINAARSTLARSGSGSTRRL